MNNLYFINGCIGEDRYIGKVTCKGLSTVDYAVGTQCIFRYVQNFKVCDFNPLYSDIHCPIELTLSRVFQDLPVYTNNYSLKTEPCRWKKSLQNKFVEFINQNDVDSITHAMVNSTHNPNDTVDNAVKSITKLFNQSARTVFGVRKTENNVQYGKRISTVHKPWFKYECIKTFHRAKHSYRLQNSKNNKQAVINASK